MHLIFPARWVRFVTGARVETPKTALAAQKRGFAWVRLAWFRAPDDLRISKNTRELTRLSVITLRDRRLSREKKSSSTLTERAARFCAEFFREPLWRLRNDEKIYTLL